MTRAKGSAQDKNLENIVQDLEHAPVNSLEAQQMQQKANDRRHYDVRNHQKETDMDPSH